MRFMILPLLLSLSACIAIGTTSSEVFLSDGSKGHNISCRGAAQNFSNCLAKAGEICGESGYSVVDQHGSTVPFSVASASATANTQTAGGAYLAQSGAIVTRNVFVKCNQSKP